MLRLLSFLLVSVASLALAVPVPGEVCNLRVMTDASPDYSDPPSMVRSITANWPTPQEKCWALFYWNHIARRQTTPMEVHGLACTDPIRQFNDYGYTMCSTIAGVNCSIWDALGYKVKYWDISMHTVSEVEYSGRYHLYDNSMSAIYTLCDGKDPEGTGSGAFRFRIRGNGVWQFKPALNDLAKAAHWTKGLRFDGSKPVTPAVAGRPGEIVFKIDGANVITGMTIRARLHRRGDDDLSRISVSTTNGSTWKEVWKNGPEPAAVDLVDEVNGAYEVLVKLELLGKRDASDARLEGIEIETTTQLNSKTQPKLLLGKNTVYVGSGEQNGSIVVWPDLRGDLWKPYAVEYKNVVAKKAHPGYMGVLHAEKAKEEAYVVFKIDAPRQITRLRYGGRLYNRAPKSHIDFLHSFDDGKTWTKSYSLTGTQPPWDVIHDETIADIPAGTKSVLVKYLLNSSQAGSDACSLYAVRMEANYQPTEPSVKPIEVTFRWAEVQADRSLVERSHTELVTRLPHRYTINVGGEDHPVVQSLGVGFQGTEKVRYGYSDNRHADGQKFTPRWVVYGKNLALHKPYTVSIPSGTQWGAGDPEGKKLTDGVIGPPYAGGIAASFGLCWTEGQKPAITVDLGRPERCGGFRIHLTGYPFWDALKGQVKDRIELLTSTDGKDFVSQGFFNLDLRWKDLPANLMWPDEENATATVFDLVAPRPVDARFVRFAITSKRFAQVSEVQVLDRIESKPFDLRISLPRE